MCIDVVDEGIGGRNGTEGLVRERAGRRDQFRALGPVTVLTGDEVRPDRVSAALRRAEADCPITVVAYLGHGEPGVLYYRRRDEQELLSDRFPVEALRAAADGRAVYFFSCRTLTAAFGGLLLQCGARRVAGFALSPAYSDLNGRKRLGDFDAYVIRSLCLGRPAADMLRHRDNVVALAAADRDRHGSIRFKRSMDELTSALNSFRVYE